ncbi:uncharacterized protein LOC141851434 [Brevipalpus obovatus]|uniref:uncharacterized protein LOC141851434 n=1 Tax=Brevipalpus obovatus TaxID=246614 RepID=UPI003D9F5ED5
MQYQVSAIGTLKLCPCCVVMIDENRKLWLIGCYQLMDEKDSSKSAIDVNQRIGSLVLIKGTEIICELDCVDGGVFDLRLMKNMENDVAARVCAAHSNGSIAFYRVTVDQIIPDVRHKSTSEMLCSLSVIQDDTDHSLVIAGDSKGKFYLANDTSILSEHEISSPLSEPIWCIHNTSFQTKWMILVGSEDSLVRIFTIPRENKSDVKKCQSILKDAGAGITSIASSINGIDDLQETHKIYVGSYDEHIRIYSLTVTRSLDASTDQLFRFSLLTRIYIENSGIWRIIPIICDEGGTKLLIAGMYGGGYVCKLSETEKTLKRIRLQASSALIQKDDIDEPTSEEETGNPQLIYGIACMTDASEILFTSFYEKKFIFVQRKE